MVGSFFLSASFLCHFLIHFPESTRRTKLQGEPGIHFYRSSCALIFNRMAVRIKTILIFSIAARAQALVPLGSVPNRKSEASIHPAASPTPHQGFTPALINRPPFDVDIASTPASAKMTPAPDLVSPNLVASDSTTSVARRVTPGGSSPSVVIVHKKGEATPAPSMNPAAIPTGTDARSFIVPGQSNVSPALAKPAPTFVIPTNNVDTYPRTPPPATQRHGPPSAAPSYQSAPPFKLPPNAGTYASPSLPNTPSGSASSKGGLDQRGISFLLIAGSLAVFGLIALI